MGKTLARPEKAGLSPSSCSLHLPPTQGQATQFYPGVLCRHPSVDTGCVLRTTLKPAGQAAWGPGGDMWSLQTDLCGPHADAHADKQRAAPGRTVTLSKPPPLGAKLSSKIPRLCHVGTSTSGGDACSWLSSGAQGFLLGFVSFLELWVKGTSFWKQDPVRTLSRSPSGRSPHR